MEAFGHGCRFPPGGEDRCPCWTTWQVPLEAQGEHAAGQAQGAASNPANVAQTAAQLRNGAWGALIGALLGLIAAGLGGIVGTRRQVVLDRTTSEVTYERR